MYLCETRVLVELLASGYVVFLLRITRIGGKLDPSQRSMTIRAYRREGLVSKLSM